MATVMGASLDADLQDDPGEIHSLLRKLEDGYDLCSGWKKKRQDPFIKNVQFLTLSRIISDKNSHFNCGLAYRKKLLKCQCLW
jgi:hypothetical protein